MGTIWIPELPSIVAATGVPYRVWPGWETRSRSSGGYDQVWAVIVHHTASSTSPDNDCSFMWDNSADRPVGAILLDRDGQVTIGAAGSTNCAGKGGPMSTSHGTIPLDKGNGYAFNIEAANAGTGERWSDAQCDAYLAIVDALCTHFELDPARDVAAHHEWTDRKIDPAGPDRWATGAASWDMADFRADLDHVPPPVPPLPPADPIAEEDTVLFAAQSKETGYYWIGDGIHRRRITADWSDDFWQFAEWGVGPVVIPFASDPRTDPPPDRVRHNVDFTECAESTLIFLGEVVE